MTTRENGTDDREGAGLLVVVGASAGGVAALQELLGALPHDFAGAVCVVMHLAPNQPSFLDRILARASALPVHAAADGAPLRPGHVHVATPDHHLQIDGDKIVLGSGPSENGHRPSVDALFRSAARWRGPAAIGVVLTGSLDDGAAGLREIMARGGRAAVQDPRRSDYPGMPTAALEAVAGDAAVGSPAELASWLAAQRPGPAIAVGADDAGRPDPEQPEPFLTCPDCHGSLHEDREGDQISFACLIGHKWSPASLEAFQRQDVEQALWAAVRALEEQAHLNARLAARSTGGRVRASASFHGAAHRAAEHAEILRRVVREVMREPAAADAPERVGPAPRAGSRTSASR
jgi:two-component system chemotaxis response regulator CheB